MIYLGIIIAAIVIFYLERITNNIHSTNLLLRDLNEKFERLSEEIEKG